MSALLAAPFKLFVALYCMRSMIAWLVDKPSTRDDYPTSWPLPVVLLFRQTLAVWNRRLLSTAKAISYYDGIDRLLLKYYGKC